MPTDSQKPSLLIRASQMASQYGFRRSCLDEVGRLLQLLSGFKSGAKIAEVGTGFGVGSAWLLSGMDPDSKLITVDSDPERVAAVRTLFDGMNNVEILHGDWKVILNHAPFDLVFVDARPAKYDEADILVDSVRRNGIIILDDFTPVEHWPEEWKGKPDTVRDKWLHDDRLLCIELRTSEKNSIFNCSPSEVTRFREAQDARTATAGEVVVNVVRDKVFLSWARERRGFGDEQGMYELSRRLGCRESYGEWNSCACCSL